MVGARGFEPPTSRSRTVRSSQAELRPVRLLYRSSTSAIVNVNPNRYEDMRPGCYDVDERVRDMSAGGQLAEGAVDAYPNPLAASRLCSSLFPLCTWLFALGP